jgi:hypothetical protein
MSYRRPLLDWIYGARSAALLLLGLGIIIFGTMAAKARMSEATWQRRVCEAKLEALQARNLFTERYVRPADPCLALEVVKR